MQLCGSSEIDFSSEPTVAGTMVSFIWNLNNAAVNITVQRSASNKLF